MDEINFVRYDGNNTLVQEVVDDANSVPLGYDHKVISLDNCYFLIPTEELEIVEISSTLHIQFSVLLKNLIC